MHAKGMKASVRISIRRALTPDAFAAAADIYRRCGDVFTWRPAGYFKPSDFLAVAREEEVFLAWIGEDAAGFATLYPPAFLHCLHVRPDRQGLGVGRALAAHLRVQARAPLTLKVDAPNLAAIGFYRATGWQPLDGPDDTGIDEGVAWRRWRLT